MSQYTLAALYRRTGINQAELARRARLSTNTVRRAEQGESISPATARAIAEVFSDVMGERILPSDITTLKID